MPSYPHIFITVGTTEFPALVAALTTAATATALRQLGCQRLTIQQGRSQLPATSAQLATIYPGVRLEIFDYRPSIRECIERADLVISHAGAGSCLESLGAGKPMLVVVNEQLQDNHQLELAERLQADGHILQCRPAELAATLGRLRLEVLRPYGGGCMEPLVRRIDELMNFA